MEAPFDGLLAFTTFADLLLGFNSFATYLQGANLWKSNFWSSTQALRHYCLLWGHLRSLLYLKKSTMITSSYYLLLSPLRWKALYFRLSRINILDLNVLHLQIVFTCLPPVKPRDIAFISSIRLGVQRWRVSWIKSVCCQYLVGWVGWGWWAVRMGVRPFAKKKKTSVESVGILDSLGQGKPGIVTQVTNNNNTFLRSRHC